ncbi:MAG: nitrous oxide reductase accessory protein NosL [Candidatus Kapaibacteriota bacterium]
MLVFRNLIHLVIILFIVSCESPKPEPIRYGLDVCNFCKMTIVDPKWGAQIITDKGKVFKFDVVECMIAFYYSKIDTNRVQGMYTINFVQPGEFIEAKQSKYVRTLQFPSPMGLNAISLKTFEDTVKLGLVGEYETLDWWHLVNKAKDEILH